MPPKHVQSNQNIAYGLVATFKQMYVLFLHVVFVYVSIYVL